MALVNATSITSMLRKSSLDDHEEILRACGAALQNSKQDLLVQQIKVVALLKLDRYDEALHVFESIGESLEDKAPLEYAYSLYKSGQPEKAVTIAAGLKDKRGARHVEAQARYRIEDFSTTANLYRELSLSEDSTEKNDLRINQGAVEAQLIWASKRAVSGFRRPEREDLEAYETAYNAACGSIARGELRQAEVLLRRAKELCKHSEDLSPEEKLAELLPLSVQQLYVLERLGKLDEARAIAAEVKAEEISDIATREIAQHNQLVVSQQPSNPYMTHKLLANSAQYSGSNKPFRFQQRAINSNKGAVDLQALKFDGVARSTAKLLKRQRVPSTSVEFTSTGVLNAAARARGKAGKPALRHLLPEHQRNPYNVGLLLSIISIYLSLHNPTSAISHLESFFARLEESPFETKQDVRFGPGLIAVAIALYRSEGRNSDATRELERAASYWGQTSDPPTSLLQKAGAALLEASGLEEPSSAAEIFSKLHKKSPEDRIASAGYVAAYAGQDLSKVSTEVEQLSSVSQLIHGIDVDGLENAGIPPSFNALAIAQRTASRKRGAPDQGSNKQKKMRKSRLPKDYDPSRTPDPERWLPLRDRSTYRPRGKKGKRKDVDRTQGGIPGDDLGAKDIGSPTGPIAGVGGGNKKNKKKNKK